MILQRALSTAAVSSHRPKTGIVMLNMGGPQTLEQVQPFLTRLFSDPDLIELPFTRSLPALERLLLSRATAVERAEVEAIGSNYIQSQLAKWITRRRLSKVTDQYAQIGNGSPILKWTTHQMTEMCKLLNQKTPSTGPHKAYVAFRYADPLTDVMLKQLTEDKPERVVVFTQYPQYSCSTTGSSLNELARCMRRSDISADNISFIDRWSTHPGLISSFAKLISKKLEQFDVADRSEVMILFSAHSLPLSVVERGDPYSQEVASTVHAIMQQLQFSNPYRLTWQSQVGPSRWLGPQTRDIVNKLGSQRRKNVLVVPVAFTSDHIETLFEIDIELQEDAAKHGMILKRCDSLNDSVDFIDAMASLVTEHLQTDTKCSKQLHYQCPGCDRKSCSEMRQYFEIGKQLHV